MKIITHNEIKKLISILGFRERERESYSKIYSLNYQIQVDFLNSTIEYSDPNFKPEDQIKVWDKSTSNFEKAENFVVLECIDRLLTKGYSPKNIQIEPQYKIGREYKGKLDILVRDSQDSTFMMIECKTWGDEFDREVKKMIKDGGQLFSYYQLDRSCKFICLYSSQISNESIEYKCNIVKLDEGFQKLNDLKEIHTRWNKQFFSNGIFENGVLPYSVELKSLIRKDLKTLGETNGSTIFNQFEEIIRHNVISDKSNAFNKIFNLFICKIMDESKPEFKELDFQWKQGKDDYISLFSRLNTLYKDGMRLFLDKEILDYSDEEVISDLNNLNGSKNSILEKFRKLRLYKNQEFAFLDVYNEESFCQNAKVVKEIVELLQHWQFRYSYKQQFLGNFFERLLNTGFKQESGQFFTPIPLARFMIESLPIEELISQKIKRKERNFLPYVVDFACGSGHFLTESMDYIQEYVQHIDESVLLTIDQVNSHKDFVGHPYAWAKEFIYGIERDYRLMKTTKLSCFLNGDGEAQIRHESGIAPFNSKGYQGTILSTNDIMLEKFDVLIANPPFSIKGFKNTVESGESSFPNVFRHITDFSRQIELVFVERMNQLIAKNGVAAIILPSSVLDNDGELHNDARKIILENFWIKCIVKLGGYTFMATNVDTVILFLKKRCDSISLIPSGNHVPGLDYDTFVCEVPLEVNQQREFLGYKFSDRKGKEGIEILKSQNRYLHDIGKIIKSSFSSEMLKKIQIDSHLLSYVRLTNLSNLVDSLDISIDNRIILAKKLVYKTKYTLGNLGDYIDFLPKSKRKAAEGKKSGKYNFYTSSEKVKKSDFCDYEKQAIIIGDGGKSSLHIDKNFAVSDHNFVIRASKDSSLTNEYIYFWLKYCFPYFSHGLKGMALQNIGKDFIKDIKIPLLTAEEQKEILVKIEKNQKKLTVIFNQVCALDEIAR